MIICSPGIVLEMVVELYWSMIIWLPQRPLLDRISFLALLSNIKWFPEMAHWKPDQWVKQSYVLCSHIHLLHYTIQAHHYFFYVLHSQRTVFWVPLPKLMYVLICHYVVPVLELLNVSLFSSIYSQNRVYLTG